MRNLKKRMIAATSAMLMLCPTTTCMAASENGSIMLLSNVSSGPTYDALYNGLIN